MNIANGLAHRAVGIWLRKLDDVPGWREWKREHMIHTYWADDQYFERGTTLPNEFIFPPQIEAEHKVVMAYTMLWATLQALYDCHFYFRRFPFRGLPIHKHDHLRYACEMYFSRFYEFSERIKNCLNAANALAPVKIPIGLIIKTYAKEFDQELRQRNLVHHHRQFDDIVLDNLAFTVRGFGDDEISDEIHRRRNTAAYRRASKEWAERVLVRKQRMETYLEVISRTLLDYCPFLGDLVDKSALKPVS